MELFALIGILITGFLVAYLVSLIPADWVHCIVGLGSAIAVWVFGMYFVLKELDRAD